MEDFKVALGRVRPSIQRDVPIQEEKKDWKDIGGLEDVKKVRTIYKVPIFFFFS